MQAKGQHIASDVIIKPAYLLERAKEENMIQIQWQPPVSAATRSFLCSKCKNRIGEREWAVGLIDGRGVRLCFDCANRISPAEKRERQAS